MHQGGLFTDRGGKLENQHYGWQTVDGKLQQEMIKYGLKKLQRSNSVITEVDEWLSSKKNVVFLCLECANVRFLIYDLEDIYRIICYGI